MSKTHFAKAMTRGSWLGDVGLSLLLLPTCLVAVGCSSFTWDGSVHMGSPLEAVEQDYLRGRSIRFYEHSGLSHADARRQAEADELWEWGEGQLYDANHHPMPERRTLDPHPQ